MEKHKHGGDIYSGDYQIDFSASINPFGPPEGVKRAVSDSITQIQNYPDTACRQLKQSLASHENISPEQLIFGNGAAELIYALALGLRPQRALLAVPGFAEYEAALKAVNCQITYYYRKDPFVLEEDYLEQITDETEILFLCNPNNPTGDLIPQAFLQRVLKRCEQKQVLMVVDQCFLDFLPQPEKYSLTQEIGSSPQLFILNAFTKLYAMPGLRLGYGMCGSRDVLAKLRLVLQPWNISLPAQLAGSAALREEAYVAKTRQLIITERRYLQEQLQMLQFQVYPGTVNFIFFRGPEDLSAKLRQIGFLIRDCSNFRGLNKGYFRIAVKTRTENDALLKAMRAMMQG